MNGKTILDHMSGIDMAYVEEAVYPKEMGLIDDEQVERTERAQANMRRIKWQPIAVAACLLIVIGIYMGISNIDKGSNSKSDNMQVTKNEMITTSVDNNKCETISEDIKDLSPVKYSEINLSLAKEFDYGNVSNGVSLCLVAFDESMLGACKDKGNIIEGTITNIYTKEYKFDTYDDKFEKKGVLHNRKDTVVYEIKVSKVWYGDCKQDTILIEDDNFLLNPVWELKIGRKYVVPIVYDGDKIYQAYWDDFKEGDCDRDSEYASLYPYNEPIEVTMDGNYLVSSEWPTLIKENAREVIMDVDGYEGYHDIYMVDSKSFQQQMEKLIESTIK